MQYLKVAKISKYVYLLNLEEEKNIDLFVKKKKKKSSILCIFGHCGSQKCTHIYVVGTLQKQNINRRFSVPVTTETLYPIKIAKINVPNFQPIKTAFTAATSSLKHCFLTVECLQSESVRCVNRGTNTLKSLTEKVTIVQFYLSTAPHLTLSRFSTGTS